MIVFLIILAMLTCLNTSILLGMCFRGAGPRTLRLDWIDAHTVEAVDVTE